MDRDAAFLRSVGINAKDGELPESEKKEKEHEQRVDKVRDAVLKALDSSLGDKGWIDADLPELFKVLDAHVERWEKRNIS